MGRLMEIASKYMTGEESLQYEVHTAKSKASVGTPGQRKQFDSGHQEKGGHDSGQKHKGCPADGVSGADLVAAANHGKQRNQGSHKPGRLWQPRQGPKLVVYEKILDQPYIFHRATDAERKAPTA